MIIITGANRGLGKAISERLVKNGKEVIGLTRSKEKLSIERIECDVSNYSSVKNVAKLIKKKKKNIEAIINCAGIASMNLALTTDETTIRKIIETNLIGTINCCQLLSPLMIRNKNGCIINFSTIAVRLALKGESIYAASKSGVEAFSKVFAREMADFNIKVNCIAPGPIKTDLINGVSDSQINKIISQQIIPKQFKKSDICDLVEILIDEKSSSLSGQVLNVGGV